MLYVRIFFFFEECIDLEPINNSFITLVCQRTISQQKGLMTTDQFLYSTVALSLSLSYWLICYN